MEDFISQEEFSADHVFRRDTSGKCNDILQLAVDNGLILEVFMSAFQHKEEFPDSSPLQCLQVGIHDWDI